MISNFKFQIFVFMTVSLILCVGCSGKDKNAAKPPEVKTVKVLKGPIELKVLFTGNIVADSAFDVYPRATGKVQKKMLKEGDAVKKNQPILLVERDEVGYKFRPMPVVSLVDGYVGRIVADIGTNVNPQEVVATVVEPGKMRLKLDVPERYIGVISSGMEVEMKADTLGDEVFKGTVITSSPYINEKTRTANVEAIFLNEDGKLKHGMFGRLYVDVDKRENILLVPIDSISWEGEKRFVFKVVESKLKRTEIKTGIRNDVHAEVTEGINENDEIVVGDLLSMKDGEKIKNTKDEGR